MAHIPGKDVMGERAIVVGIIFSLLATAAVLGRVWARRLKKVDLQLSDYLAMMALVCTLGLNATIITAAISGGSGQHTTTISLAEEITLLKAFLAAGVLWAFAIAFVKLSVLAFYTAIFRDAVFKAVTYTVAALSISLMLAVILATLLICRPLAYNWDRKIKGTCGDTSALYLGGGIANLILDVVIVMLPMPMLWRLQMKRSRKVALTFIFGLGAFVCILSILRVVAIHNLSLLDLSYTSAADGIWSVLEPSLGVVAACLPIMQPVISKVSDITSTLFSRTRGTSQRSLRASSRPIPDQDQRPLTKRAPEDMIYPLSNFGETINEVETVALPYGAEYPAWRADQMPRHADHSINVKHGYAVQSEARA